MLAGSREIHATIRIANAQAAFDRRQGNHRVGIRCLSQQPRITLARIVFDMHAILREDNVVLQRAKPTILFELEATIVIFGRGR